MPFRFEGLQIWHQARAFSNEVYRLAAEFPDYKRYSLTSQMTRAANSISLNIAEGAGRDTDIDLTVFWESLLALLLKSLAHRFWHLIEVMLMPKLKVCSMNGRSSWQRALTASAEL